MYRVYVYTNGNRKSYGVLAQAIRAELVEWQFFWPENYEPLKSGKEATLDG